jgi:Protein of unknown function DUF58
VSYAAPLATWKRRRARPAASRSLLTQLLGPTNWLRAQRHRLPSTGRWIGPTGWVAICGAVIGLGAGVIEGWTELRVIGLSCALLVILALAWVLGRTSYDVSFNLHRSRVVAGDTASGSVNIRNQARRSMFPTRIELTVGKGRAHFLLPSLGKDETHEELFDVPTRRRSVITIGPVSSVRTDPLGMLRRTQNWSNSVDLYVHPQTVHLSNDHTGFIRDIEGVTTQDLSSNDVSFHALRDYQPGDDRRSIHWRTTARTGRLMVRQFEETRRAHLLVILPTCLDDYSSSADFESAISIGGSLARHAFAEGRQVSIFTTSGNLAFTTSPLMLDRLSELTAAPTSLSLRDLAARAIGIVPQASVAVLIAGGGTEPAHWRVAHKALPVTVSSFGLRCAAELTLARRRVGDLAVVDLPDVHALPRALRSIK